MSGLSAAVEMGRAGLTVLILEARDRIGGRMFTRRDPSNAPIELGAEFIHGRPPEIWSLLQQGGLEPEEMSGEDWCFRDQQLCACDFFSAVDKILEKLDDRGPDESFTAFLKRCTADCADEDAQRWAVGYVRGFHAADPNLISVHALVKGIRADEKIDGERAFRLPQGYESLLALLSKELVETPTSIRLETVVERVKWSAGRVRIEAREPERKAEFESRRVLVTVPLGVLQSDGGLNFSPNLPQSKENALHFLAMGKVMRVTLRFRERFWDKLHSPSSPQRSLSDLRFLFSQESWFPTWWTAPGKLPMITGWAPASFAEQLSGQSEGYVLGTALHSLSSLLSVSENELEQMLEAAAWHDWQSDPFARGAYSYVKVGGDTAQQTLGAPVENTLFFAGEATDVSGHTGTVHGAIASGRRAAGEILRSL